MTQFSWYQEKYPWPFYFYFNQQLCWWWEKWVKAEGNNNICYLVVMNRTITIQMTPWNLECYCNCYQMMLAEQYRILEISINEGVWSPPKTFSFSPQNWCSVKQSGMFPDQGVPIGLKRGTRGIFALIWVVYDRPCGCLKIALIFGGLHVKVESHIFMPWFLFL